MVSWRTRNRALKGMLKNYRNRALTGWSDDKNHAERKYGGLKTELWKAGWRTRNRALNGSLEDKEQSSEW
jgi:hypothetical protein